MHPEFELVARARVEKVEWTRRLWNAAAAASSSGPATTTPDYWLRIPVPKWMTDTNTETDADLLLLDDVASATASTPANTGSLFILRPLSDTEISTLQSSVCRCRSTDWSLHRLLLPTTSTTMNCARDQSLRLQKLVSNTCFEGTVVFFLLQHYFNNTGTPTNQRNGGSSKTETNTANSSSTGNTFQQQLQLLPLGIHNCAVISNSIVHMDSARVHDCTSIAQAYISPHAIVSRCGCICVTQQQSNHPCVWGKSNDNKHWEVRVGPESGGGRSVRLTPESTMKDVGRQLIVGTNNTTEPTTTTTSDAQNSQRYAGKRNVVRFNEIGCFCVVRDTATIDTLYLHSHASIVGATRVQNALLFPYSSIEGTGSTASAVVLQWHSRIAQSSTVSDAILMEHAEVGPSAIVSHSILGPDVQVSAGEVHASILGPNTNAHHQSLLISVVWPAGRGNVGYGANVGSNHTGRIPDQECTAGEGTFWGLSCVVKFPVDLSCAPYSIVAAGTSLSPMRCTMPFSLLVTGGVEETSGMSTTSIVPGWVWNHSPYTLVRSEQKFATRRKATRHADYTGWKILRPEIINLVAAARHALESVATIKDFYDSDSDIPGIGQTRLSEAGRQAAISSYTECIQQFALHGMYDFLSTVSHDNSKKQVQSDKPDSVLCLTDYWVNECLTTFLLPSDGSNINNGMLTTTLGTASAVHWPVFPWDADQSPRAFWRSQRALLAKEFPIPQQTPPPSDAASTKRLVVGWTVALLNLFLERERAFSQRVYKCKHRDDVRGIATIPDYAAAHVLADQDPVILSVQSGLRVKEATVLSLIRELEVGSNAAAVHSRL